jgi:2-dehydro-3-deoxy-L-rhamnonate dehydrogenase (NAD+)
MSTQIDLKGRVAVITGGARGIGYAAAQRMLASGAIVVLWDMDGGKLSEAKTELASAGTVSSDVVELTEEASVKAATEAVIARSTSWSTMQASPGAMPRPGSSIRQPGAR